MSAPIILFAYNRPHFVSKVLESLLKNPECKNSKIYIYVDGPAKEEDLKSNMIIKTMVENVKGFNKKILIYSKTNKGLSASITEGISEVLSIEESAIILEDDIITSPAFLGFMNRALDYYKNSDHVWHINGWSYPLNYSPNVETDCFLWRLMSCWGWATWSDRWKFYSKKNILEIKDDLSRSKEEFDLGTYLFWPQILKNAYGVLDSWAIFWYSTIFLNKGLCLTPKQSFVQNIGLDGSGINSKIKDNNIFSHTNLNLNRGLNLSCSSIENYEAIHLFKKIYKKQAIESILRESYYLFLMLKSKL